MDTDLAALPVFAGRSGIVFRVRSKAEAVKKRFNVNRKRFDPQLIHVADTRAGKAAFADLIATLEQSALKPCPL